MLELYLLVTLLTGSPNAAVQTFSDIQGACSAYDAAQAQPGTTPHIYKESIDYHKNVATIEEGQCKPVKQFFKAQ